MRRTGDHGGAYRRPSVRPLRVLFVMDRLHETGGTRNYLQILPRVDPVRMTPSCACPRPGIRSPAASRSVAGYGPSPIFERRAHGQSCVRGHGCVS
jgi:hypothetical protein